MACDEGGETSCRNDGRSGDYVDVMSKNELEEEDVDTKKRRKRRRRKNTKEHIGRKKTADQLSLTRLFDI